MEKLDRVSAFIWIIVGIFFLIGGIKYNVGNFHNPDAGFFPILAGSLLSLLGSILIFSTFSKEQEEERNEKAKERNILGKEAWKTSYIPSLTLLILFLYTFLLEVLGFILTTLLCLFLLFRLTNPKRWLMPLILSVSAIILSHLIFSVWLKCQLPRGVLTHLF